MDNLKKYYTTVYAVVYSSCGSYLAAANSYGYIAIFKLSNLFENDVNTQLEVSPKYPVFKFSAHVGPIYSLMSTKQFLIRIKNINIYIFYLCSGGIGELKLWKWSDVKKKEAKSLWTFFVPQGESLTKPEINSLGMSKKEDDGILFAGCGDNKIYCLNIEKQSLLVGLLYKNVFMHYASILIVCLLLISQKN
ncbi:UNVERIFIED_CONTAM: Thoc6 [Trichonephila clavipes]